jgi:hypothetical protein
MEGGEIQSLQAHGRSGGDRSGGRLASSDSSFMTASEVAVDGGLAQL